MVDELDLEENPTLSTISLPTLLTRPVTLPPPRTTAPTGFIPRTRAPTDILYPRAVDQGEGGPLFLVA